VTFVTHMIGQKISGAVFGLFLLPVMACGYNFSGFAVVIFTMLVEAPTMMAFSHYHFSNTGKDYLSAIVGKDAFNLPPPPAGNGPTADRRKESG
jgi:hypothetical protein